MQQNLNVLKKKAELLPSLKSYANRLTVGEKNISLLHVETLGNLLE
jgi:hypothetical protein